jgi:hypothetical protein
MIINKIPLKPQIPHFGKATLPHQQEQLKQRSAFTDKEIDTLVYELCGLSEEEIKL